MFRDAELVSLPPAKHSAAHRVLRESLECGLLTFVRFDPQCADALDVALMELEGGWKSRGGGVCEIRGEEARTEQAFLDRFYDFFRDDPDLGRDLDRNLASMSSVLWGGGLLSKPSPRLWIWRDVKFLADADFSFFFQAMTEFLLRIGKKAGPRYWGLVRGAAPPMEAAILVTAVWTYAAPLEGAPVGEELTRFLGARVPQELRSLPIRIVRFLP